MGQRQPPDRLIVFLDKLYSDFDALVDKHALEKIKVSGDSYMVVSGVPRPRPITSRHWPTWRWTWPTLHGTDKDLHGRPVPMRIGLASGPVVAGVVGSR